MRPFITLSFVLALAPSAPLVAQYVQPLPQAGMTSDADALAEQVRALAVNPSDLNALVRAGELALKLEDSTAAAAFFARAERIDPRNARVKAGMGVLLVQAERPGEALRRFAEAESYGARPATIAADRGLAYDLIGEQERAQRDYRLALKTGPNDETTRRYALSLGISGKREEALALLDPLLRNSDRGAWRARAFILAMSGDRVDAGQIATTMMPAGMSQGMQPFFDRLAALSPVDRAFAVHFGEVRSSTQRIADARLVPPLPPLGADPDARELAAAAQARQNPARVVETQVARPDKRKRGKRQPVELAVQVAAPPVALPLPTPPAYVDPAGAARNSATPGQTNYYVQRLPSARVTAPGYTPQTYTRPSYNAVAQANRAAAAASVPAAPAPVPGYTPAAQAYPAATGATTPSQPRAAPVYQPFQPGGGRVMPLAPLQAQPLPSTVYAPAAVPVRPAPVVTPPAEIATRVERAPAAIVAKPPVETATRVERAPQYTASSPAAPAAAPVVATPTQAANIQQSVIAPQPAAPTVPAPVSATPIAPAPIQTVNIAPSLVQPTTRAADTSGDGVPAAARPASAPFKPAPFTPAATAPAHAAPTHRQPTPERAAKTYPTKLTVVEAEDPVETKRSSERKGTARATDGEADTAARKPGARKAADEASVDTRKKGAAKKGADTEEDADAKPVTNLRGKKAGTRIGTEAEDDADAKSGTKLNGKKAVTKKGTQPDADAEDSSATKRTGKKAGAKKGAEPEDEADGKPTSKLADKKAAAKKAADATKKDPKTSEPSRVWVQVSGGANENDLPKQWSKLRADQPAMFKNRQGYSTPLRATNRILTGPFASEAEAQAYVNKLAKQGLSGFLFTSEAGQKVNKLPAK